MKRRWLIVGGLTLLFGIAGLALRVRKMRRLAAALAAAAAPTPTPTARVPQPLQVAEVIYDGGLKRGWDDWGWGMHRLGTGPAEISFAGFGGILFHHAQLPSRYAGLSFRYQAPAKWGEFMHVTLMQTGVPEDAFPLVAVEPHHVAELEGWREVLIPWKELNPKEQPFDRIRVGSRTRVGDELVKLDRVVLIKGNTAGGSNGKPNLRVLCDKPSHPISELIYGNSTEDWSSGQSAQRIGGNALSRLNWDIGATNTGKDWFFENSIQKKNTFDSLDGVAKGKHPLAMVVPMIGWVSKDGTSVGFPRSKFPTQQKFDPYKSEAGNGVGADGKLLVPVDPSQTSVPAPPELIEEWIKKLVAQNSKRGYRGVTSYILDNEPALWNVNHRDVHPDPVSYDELLERTLKYAKAIRAADPDAEIAGPAFWGWAEYFSSAVDRDGVTRDRAAHGGEALVLWYLKQLAAEARKTGHRLLDVLDLHFYPQGQGVFADAGAAKDPVTAELRLRSTRALWDPTYFDESWIQDAVRLIPRMKEWVRDGYPGTKLSIGEWSFGAEDHISGGLATAEALGRFGQQGLDSAFHWGDLKQGQPGYWAFRAFRDFDGKGGRFLDESLATEEDEQVSLFASRDESRSKLVLILVNKSPDSSIDAEIALSGCGDLSKVRAFAYDAHASALNEGKATLSKTEVAAKLEPYSISVIELATPDSSTSSKAARTPKP